MSQADLPVSGVSDGPQAVQSGPNRWLRTAWWAVLAILLVFNLSLFMPWGTSSPGRGDELDASWGMVLHWAHIHRMDFGHQIVFTYGPWGFIFGRWGPETFKWVMCGWALLAMAYFAGIVGISRHLEWPRWAVALWMAVVIALAGSSVAPDIRLFVLSWLLMLLDLHVDDRPVTATKLLLVIAMALAGLMKFSALAMALAILVVMSVEHVRRRRVPWLLTIYVVACLGWWLAAGQRLGSIGSYLRHSWDLAAGYAQGAALTQPGEAWNVAMFLLCAAALVAMAAVASALSEGGGRSVTAAAAAAVALFFVFKVGYVRHDEHEMTSTGAIAVFALLAAAALWPKLEKPWCKWSMAAVAWSSVWLGWHSTAVMAHADAHFFWADAINTFPAHVLEAARWTVGRPVLDQKHQAQLEELRSTALPQVRGTVDVYSWGQDVVLAAGLDYHPRPVFQSYLTYTPLLQRLNADFLDSAQAPQNILMRVENVDAHYPSQDDSLSWPLLLTRYDLTDASKGWLLLRRAAAKRDFSIVPLQQTDAPMRQWVHVPESPDPVWVTIHVQPTAEGQVMQTLYKTPDLLLDIKTKKGPAGPFRLVRRTAESGFLLSPMVQDNISFALLGSTSWAEDLSDMQVSDLRILVNTPSGTSPDFETRYTVDLGRLQFAHADLSAVPGVADGRRFRRLFADFQVLQAEAPPQTIADKRGRGLYLAPARCDILIHAPAQSRSVHLGFGMLDRSYLKEKTDGVEFRLVAISQITPQGMQGAVIWSRRLDPVAVESDRGLQHADVALPALTPVGIVLQTVPGPTHTASLSYWTDIWFR